VRNVDQSAKAQTDGQPPTPAGWFAAIVGNRFPEAGTSAGPTQSRAYLVSFEGWGDYLAGGSQYASLENLTTTNLRFAVLASWTFSDISNVGGAVGADFKADVQALAPGPLVLPLAPATQQNTDAVAVTNMGYVALNHVTRQGETTAAFYRGPLVPTAVEEQVSAYVSGVQATNWPSWPCADAALRFDASLGIFDVSYSAAWELGRLLALRDVQFAQSIQGFRRSLLVNVQSTLGAAATANRISAVDVPVDTKTLRTAQPYRVPLARAFQQRILPVLLGDRASGAPGRFGPPGNRLSKNPNRARAFAAAPRPTAEEDDR
jgi:hypothetical protein